MPPDLIDSFGFDYIVVTPRFNQLKIVRQLLGLGVVADQIVTYNEKVYAPWVSKVKEDGIYIDTGNVKLIWKDDIVEGITREIFSSQSYNYGGISGKQVVFDIGMNVGVASLYFAQRKDVVKVYSFEPFKKTYQRALENFNLNDNNIREKIEPHNFGLSDKDEEVDAIFMEDNIGGNRAMYVEGREGIPERVLCKNAGVYLGGLIDEYPETKFILKIDCEGGEYKILKSLKEKGLIGKFSVVVCETHDGRQEEVQLLFEKYGFVWFWKRSTPTLGFFYAVKC